MIGFFPSVLRSVFGFWFFLFPWPASAAVFNGDPSNYLDLLKGLTSGDTLIVRPGEYKAGLPISRMNGEKDRPIVISGPEEGPRPLFIARIGRNTISIVDSSFVTIRNLEMDGRGLPVDGVKAEGHAQWAHHITLENLLIRGHGRNQQTVAISTKCPAWGWVIRGNEIVGAGTGLYLGNSDGSAPFVAGLIEHNLVADTIGYNLQIKHQKRRPEVQGMPAGKNLTIIRHNVFSKELGGSSGPAARPNVLIGHGPLSGPGSDDVTVLYGNVFYQNPHEALFQGEGNIALYSNLLVNRQGDAIRIQPHNDVPRKVDVFGNTIVAAGVGILIKTQEGSAAEGFRRAVVSNAVFSGRPIEGSVFGGNVAGPLDAAAGYLTRPFGPLGEMDLYPLPGRMKFDPPDSGGFRSFPDWNQDFSGRPRDWQFRGAYSGEGENPGWIPRLEKKPWRSSGRDSMSGIGN